MTENYMNITNETFYSNASLSVCNSIGIELFDVVVSISYVTIMIVSLLGNGIVCYLVQCAPKFRSVRNLFISNLSIGDILVTLLCVPFSFISTLILQYWPFGEEMCRMVSYFQAVSVFVSAYTLVAISMDRYLVIINPLRPRMTKSQAKIIIAVVWFVAFLTALPVGLMSQLFQPTKWYYQCGLKVCSEQWTSPDLHFSYTVVLAILQYALPFLLLVFTCTRIAIVVWGKETPGEAENTRDMRIAGRKRKMIKMLVMVVVVFTTCWLPYNILIILIEKYEQLNLWPGTKYLYFFFHWLAMSHTCYNPIIYAYMNDRYRAGFISVLSKVPCLRRVLPQVTHDIRGTSIGMTVFDPDHESSLRRYNTYNNMSRSKNGTLRSSLLFHNNSLHGPDD